MEPIYKKPFVQFVKKAHKPLQLAIEDEVEVVRADPGVGEAKVGDPAGIRVHKFKFNRQEYLIAYRLPGPGRRAAGADLEMLWIDFYKAGSHENFYDGLKQYLKAERTE